MVGALHQGSTTMMWASVVLSRSWAELYKNKKQTAFPDLFTQCSALHRLILDILYERMGVNILTSFECVQVYVCVSRSFSSLGGFSIELCVTFFCQI